MTDDQPDLTPKARRTRALLIAAARTELGRTGVGGVTVMSICDRAGVGRTSFYTYFDDTDALIAVVAGQIAREIKHRFDRLHQDRPRGRARLAACLRMLLTTAAQEPETILLLVSLSAWAPGVIDILDTEIRSELAGFMPGPDDRRAVLGRYLGIAVLALAQAMAEGRIGPDEIDQHVDTMMSACG